MSVDFLTLGISKEIVNLLKKNGIKEATSVQQQAVPVLLSGKDIIAKAQTGTGKTLAFLLPVLEKIDASKPLIQALIITPTRELALQVTNEVRKLAPAKGINILSVYGGQNVETQIKKLKDGIHIIIGTPGRLLDHIRRETAELGNASMLVLDEADQMLEMGFLDDIEKIISHLPKKRQTMLFSATIPGEISSMASRYMQEPAKIYVQSTNVTLDEIRQVVVETTDRAKQDALCKAIDQYRPFMAIIFCRTKRRVSALNAALQGRGYSSDELHGDLTQSKREKVMKTFRSADLQLLVATDVAARGLDIEGVTHIFNYDIPQDTESYIHRIGRTGRAGQGGVAITFVASKDRGFLDMIEKGIKTTIEKHRMENSKIQDNNESAGRVRRNMHKGSGVSKYQDRFKKARKPGNSTRTANSTSNREGKRIQQKRP